MNNITAHTKQLGIIGCPVEHSFSPAMHNFISSEIGCDYVYSAFNVMPSDLSDAIKGIKALGIRGVNVTAPHKQHVMQYLDEISPQAKLLGSVNTIVNRDGKLHGYNTDSEGFYSALKYSGVNIEGSNILVIGCGGVVQPTLIRLIQSKPKKITVLNRTRTKVDLLYENLYKIINFKIERELSEFDFDIVINTTSVGMEPQEKMLPIESIKEIDDMDFIKPGMTVVDMIYNPSETLFLKESRLRGAKTINGLGMLIYQGILAYELFTDTKLDRNIADKIRKEVFGL